MSASAVNGAWMMTVTLLALSTIGLVSGIHTSLTDYENKMMENGTLVYNSLSTGQKATLFRDFEINYSREYATPKDREMRYKVFKETLKRVDKLNAVEKADNGTAVYGINKMSDLSPQEFQSTYLGTKMPKESKMLLTNVVEVEAFHGESTSVDWTGILTTPIKNQGGCGSCWAFIAVEQIESDAIKAGITTPKDPLSVQQIFQCTYTPPNCAGGWYTTAFDSVGAAGGITYDSAYPYNTTARKCDKGKNDFPVTVKTWHRVEGQQSMINHILNGGTLIAAVDASNFHSYTSGIFSNCPNSYANHGVQIVGVNVAGGYWIVRNSWDTWWGDKGYMKLALTPGVNSCLIENFAVYVDVAPVKRRKTRMPSSSPIAPTKKPTPKPSLTPTSSPSMKPTTKPFTAATNFPISSPTMKPIPTPTRTPVSSPTMKPIPTPTRTPVLSPTEQPTPNESRTPVSSPTMKPTPTPSRTPVSSPTMKPTPTPSRTPVSSPTMKPTPTPSRTPVSSPTMKPTPTPSRTPVSSRTMKPERARPTRIPRPPRRTRKPRTSQPSSTER